MKRVLVLIFALVSAFGFAHDTSISGLKLILNGDSAILSVQTHLAKVGKQENLATMLKLKVNGEPLKIENPTYIPDKQADILMMQMTIPSKVEAFEVSERLFPKDPNSKLIVTVMRDGEAVGEGVLSNEFPSWTYGKVTKPNALRTMKDFLLMGIEHILSGPDHLLFIFGLMLARPRIKELVKVATGFTVAHSITLSLCALNIFTLPSKIVEPLIALSIVAVAAEKFLKPNDKVWRTVAIAFCFGLIHGFGFAGALTEAGLPPGQAAVSLLSFNVGVELVQISLILVGIPILLWLQEKKPKVYQPATVAAAICISVFGLFWFGERIVRGG